MPKYEDPAETLRIEAEKAASPRRDFKIAMSSNYGQPKNPTDTLGIEAEKRSAFDQGQLRLAMDELRRQISPAMRK